MGKDRKENSPIKKQQVNPAALSIEIDSLITMV